MSTYHPLYPEMTHSDKIQAIYDHVARIMDILPSLNPLAVELLLTDLADLESSATHWEVCQEDISAVMETYETKSV
ncbi:MAG: hypothetical protein K8L97_31190 [Anaerolineae bacterium]|nr:hypothetical protein [Anaerolineae bacterium]